MNKNTLRKLGKCLKPFKKCLEFLFETESRLAAKWAYSAHYRLYATQWGIPPQPEFFDHSIDLYYGWKNSRSFFWLERGVFGSLAVPMDSEVLELASGDGFNTRNFYSHKARKVIACDFDPKAIKTARSKNSAPNIDFVIADIRTAMPQGKFDAVLWDAAIEHFTETEMSLILQNIRERMKPNAVLSCHTIVERESGEKSLEHHEHEFKSKEELLRILSPHFKNVTVFETIYKNRHNLYSWASDGPLPFSADWIYFNQTMRS